MNPEITLDGETFKMQDIKEMKLEQIEGSDPPAFQMYVIFTSGRGQFYPMTLENVAAMNAWFAHVLTFSPAHARALKAPGG